ncbi:MAG: META domain-containing protein [Acidobacteria bacterium]|nr:META domain-containing protein [Acidobacteriota bacterium]
MGAGHRIRPGTRRRFRAQRLALGVAASAVLLAACGGGESSGSLEDSAWTLTGVDDLQVPPGVLATAIFTADGQVGGTTGCNSFSGPYQTDGSDISMGPLKQTLAGCTNPEAQALEGSYLIVLETADSYTVGDDTLELTESGSGSTARFDRFEADLGGTSWNAVSINTGTEAVRSVLQGTMVTADFQDAGLLAGSGGCNTYATAYRVEGDYDVSTGQTLQIAAISSGGKTCEPDVMEQEEAFFAALRNSASWVIRAGQLELRSSDGALQVQMALQGLLPEF